MRERRCPIDTHTTDKPTVRTPYESITGAIDILERCAEATLDVADKVKGGNISDLRAIAILMRSDAAAVSTCVMILRLAARRM